MKKFYGILAVLVLATAFGFVEFHVSAQSESPTDTQSPTISNALLISQFQAGGTGNANDEFIEIHNVSANAIDLNGHRLVYRSAGGTNDVGPLALWSTPTVLQPGQFYLVASTAYTGGVSPNTTYDSGVCACSMGAGGGGLAIRNGAQNTGTIVDSVGWGTATNAFVETTVSAAPANSTSQIRAQNGCQDTDNNSADFANSNPSAARNQSITFACSGGGSNSLAGSGVGSPSSVAPGGLTLLTVTVTPATNPSSTGITVNGDLTSISGAAVQQFFDDGTNGDATTGDNIFSYFAVIPANSSGGLRSLPISIADAQTRSATTTINLTITAPPDPAEHILLGNPSGAVTDVNNPFNYLLVKSQYVLSYHRDRGIPNWVAWHLDATWIGTANRQNDFRPDTSLPAGWYQVTDADYSGSGFDRGHHCPSGDRTNNVADNSATFFMTNMMPQASNNNQGVWADLEVYSRTLVSQGNELYIYAGGTGTGGTGTNGFTNTIANGHVTVPSLTWKVILVLPNGGNDLDRVGKTTRTIAVIMPNNQTVGAPGSGNWKNYRVSVNKVEALTGYSFFTNVRPIVRGVLKQRVDTTP